MAVTRQHVHRARTASSVTFGVLILLNSADALWDPGGWAWTALGVTVWVAFNVATSVLAVLWVVRRRARRRLEVRRAGNP
ncbi:hypothetical protein ACGFZL_20225 [Streptomyces sp. NPDC048182]|uniref:hypothetical protein n=1 Tax=Streptomyces sp. NPDC048182 TaxID=3365507 RepID=UPI0037139126